MADLNWVQPHLEVISRDNEHADRYIVSCLLAYGLIVEHFGKLYVTSTGRAAM